DPDNEGKTVWKFQAGKGGALGGVEWGSAADDQAAYVPVSDVLAAPGDAGGLFALKLGTGEPLWHTPAPKLECNTGRGCTGAQSAPASVIPGVVFSGAVDERNLDATLLPELLDSDVDWRLKTHLELSTHRPAIGRAILLAKRRVLLPLTRWLFEYSQENFRRQDRLNRVLFACIEELALENARLRRALAARADAR